MNSFPRWKFWNPRSGYFGGAIMGGIVFGFALAGLISAAVLFFVLGLLLYKQSLESGK